MKGEFWSQSDCQCIANPCLVEQENGAVPLVCLPEPKPEPIPEPICFCPLNKPCVCESQIYTLE